MRTTLTIEDSVYRAVKARAAQTGQTVGSIVEEALRTMLLTQSPVAAADLPVLVTHTGEGLMPGVDLDDNAAVQQVIDAGQGIDALR